MRSYNNNNNNNYNNYNSENNNNLLEIDVAESETLIELPTTVQELLVQSEVKRQLRSQPVYLKYFWKILLIISVFYSLPSIQFVFFQYSDTDIKCYFNYKCVRPFLGLTAFNNVLSNIFYLFAGSLFLGIVHYTRSKEDGIHGLHTDMSLYYSMGLTIVLEGFFSALYHVCPSKLNFQFDTTYMLIGSGLLFFTLHQKRHATFTAGAFKSFTFFAFFIFFNFLSLTNINVYVFWGLFICLFGYISIVGSSYLLAHKRLSLNPSFSIIWNNIKRLRHPSQMDDKCRFFSIIFANLFSWAFVITCAIMGVVSNMSKNFSNLIFFDESLQLNKPCVVFNYFDTHDVWHFFSAVGLFSIMSIVYFIDWDLRNVPRSLIHVF
eukprot:gene1503-1895_t